MVYKDLRRRDAVLLAWAYMRRLRSSRMEYGRFPNLLSESRFPTNFGFYSALEERSPG